MYQKVVAIFSSPTIILFTIEENSLIGWENIVLALSHTQRLYTELLTSFVSWSGKVGRDGSDVHAHILTTQRQSLQDMPWGFIQLITDKTLVGSRVPLIYSKLILQ